MSRMKRGWTPVALGTAIGLLIGLGAGAGTGLVSDRTPLISEFARSSPMAPRASSPPSGQTAAPAKNQTPAKPPSASPAVKAGPAKASAACGTSAARLVRFRVAVEEGLDTSPDRFVQDVLSVLCDKRSWIAGGRVRFQYDPRGSLLVAVRTPDSTERRCMQLVGLSVNRYYSCGSSREVVLNSDRWFGGSRHWPGSLGAYRQMLVNHEIGHAIGQHHRTCSADGAPAPVMMQQSKGMTTGGRTCKPNPWPLPSELSTVGR